MEGTDIEDRLDLRLLDEKAARLERQQRALMKRKLRAFRATVEFLAGSKADIVLVNLEDLWGEVLPQNVPATNQERPNWRRRFRRSIEQIRRSADIAEELSHVFANRSGPLPLQ
jgi:4-alpha-glucanotransferase